MAFSASNTPNCSSPEGEEALLLELGHIWNARHSTVFKIRLGHCQEEWSSSLPGQLAWWSLQCPNLAGNLWMHSIDMGQSCQVIERQAICLSPVRFHLPRIACRALLTASRVHLIRGRKRVRTWPGLQGCVRWIRIAIFQKFEDDRWSTTLIWRDSSDVQSSWLRTWWCARRISWLCGKETFLFSPNLLGCPLCGRYCCSFAIFIGDLGLLFAEGSSFFFSNGSSRVPSGICRRKTFPPTLVLHEDRALVGGTFRLQ